VTTGPEELEVRTNTRRTLVRMAVLYVPLAVICIAVALYSFSHFLGGATGAIVPAFFVGIFAFAFTVEGLAAVRDLRSAGPVTSQGMVRRTWSRGGLLWFFRSHYMFAGDTVYSVEPLTSVTVRAGDTVEVDHWPHTKTVIAVRLLSQGSGVADPDTRPTYR